MGVEINPDEIKLRRWIQGKTPFTGKFSQIIGEEELALKTCPSFILAINQAARYTNQITPCNNPHCPVKVTVGNPRYALVEGECSPG